MTAPTSGWYPDPFPSPPPGQLRWWDGGQWSDHVAEGPGSLAPGTGRGATETTPTSPWSTGPGPGAPAQASPTGSWPGGGPGGPGQAGTWTGGPAPQGPVADPVRDLEGVRKAGRVARVAVLAGVVVLVGNAILTAVIVPPVWDALRDYFDVVGSLAPGETPPTLVLPRWVSVVQAVSPLFSVGFIVVQVMFATWLYRASELARRAGQPLKRSPGWAVAGLFIPVVNLWWPYQSVKSLFPPGAERPRLGLWWTLHLLIWLIMIPVVATAFVSVPLAVVVAVVVAVVPLGEALLVRTIITAVDRAQTDLVGSRTR